MKALLGNAAILKGEQERRLVVLERQKQKLLDADMEETMSVEDVKIRQAKILGELRQAKGLLSAHQHQADDFDAIPTDVVDAVISLAYDYQVDGLAGTAAQGGRASAIRTSAQSTSPRGAHDASSAAERRQFAGFVSAKTKNPRLAFAYRGANVAQLAETVGFEVSQCDHVTMFSMLFIDVSANESRQNHFKSRV